MDSTLPIGESFDTSAGLGVSVGVAICLGTATAVGVTVVARTASGVTVDGDNRVGGAVAVDDTPEVNRSETSVGVAVVLVEQPLRQMITMVRTDSNLPDDLTQASPRDRRRKDL